MIRNFILFIFMSLSIIFFSACDAWDYGEHPQVTAVKKIAEYADSNDTNNQPDANLYKTAGVEIDIEDINATNSYIRTLSYSDVDTREEIQAVVDNLDAYTNIKPTARISVESSSVKVGQVIYLDALQSSDSDGAIVSYLWKIGGRLVHTGVAYDALLPKGRHIVELVVADEYNATDSDSVSVIVRAVDDNDTTPINKAPVAQIKVTDNNSTILLESISTDDKEVVQIEWKEGATVLATNVNPYDASKLAKGDHTIVLIVKDKEGLTDSATETITIK